MAKQKKFSLAWNHLLLPATLLTATLCLTLLIGSALTFYRLSSHSLSLSSAPETILEPAAKSRIASAPRIAVLCSPMGSTPLETLVPLALLPGAELVSYSETPRGCRIAPGLSLRPHHALLAENLPSFDAWVLPPLAASDSPALWKKLMQVVSSSKRLLALGESVRFAAIALDHAKRPPALAVPYSTQKEISKSFPEARWVSGKRVVIHRDSQRTLVSSPGLAATAEAVRALVASEHGVNEPEGSADPTLPRSTPRLSIPNLATFVRWIGFQPHPLHAQLVLQNGVDEWGLGSLLEVFGKSGAVALSYPAVSTLTTKRGFEVLLSPRGPVGQKPDLIVPPANTALERSELTALELLYGAMGQGSENWIRVLASRLLLPAPDFAQLGDTPPRSTQVAFFFALWSGLSAAAAAAVFLLRRLF